MKCFGCSTSILNIVFKYMYVLIESCRVSCGQKGRCTGIEQCNCTKGWSIPQCAQPDNTNQSIVSCINFKYKNYFFIIVPSSDHDEAAVLASAITVPVIIILIILVSILIFTIIVRRRKTLQHINNR